MKLARSIQNTNSSQVLQAAAKAAMLRARAIDVIDLTMGEPDFATPSHIIEAAYKSAKRGNTHYPPPSGTPELKAAVVQKFQYENGLSFSPNEILIGVGAKQVIYNALKATIDIGDEVIIPSPYWTSYADMTSINGATAKFIYTSVDASYKLTANQLEKAITENTRWLILNSPNNPTGTIYTKAEFEDIGCVLRRHPHIMILSDEIYEHILFDDAEFCSISQVCPDLSGRILIVNGVSKAYAMTGWRIGFGAGNERLIAAMTNVQSNSTSGASVIAQAAARQALVGEKSARQGMIAEFSNRKDYMYRALSEIPGLEVPAPQGAFYLFPDFTNFLGIKSKGNCKSTLELSEWLLNEHHIALVAGEAFGHPGAMRISFAENIGTLQQAAQRLNNALG